MTRAELLEAFLSGPDRVEKRLTELPHELMHYKPSPDAWSVHEIIIHLADSESNAALRA